MQNYPTLHGSEKEKARGLILDQFHGTMAIPKDSTQVQAKGSKVGVGDSQGHITHHVMTKDGKGSDVTINFNPGVCGDAGGLGLSSAGWSSDEVLFHELVHAMSCIEGTDTTFVPFLSPLGDLMYDSFDNLEEFTAIVIANVYRSECGRRGLRASHKGKHMMELEASGQEFYNFYQQDMKQMCMFHRMTARELKRAVNIPFNPFVYCEV